MSPTPIQEARELRRTLLVENHGTPEEQKDNLVSEILRHLSPTSWPITDGERTAFIIMAYERAQNIRATEERT